MRSEIKLDEYQEAVASWDKGLAVCAATAGSGKTTVLIERTARLIQSNVPPSRICALVYNTTAAESFRQRLQRRIGSRAMQVQASTFHSWGYALLRHWYRGEEALKPKRILTAEGCDIRPGDIVFPILKKIGLKTDMDTALSYAALMSECLIDFRESANPVNEEVVGKLLPDIPSVHLKKWMRFFYMLEQNKKLLKVIDFSDMLFLVAQQILHNGESAHVQALHSLYTHVMVDEAQDLNPARLIITQALAVRAQSALYVGDPNQGIYGYGGADPLTLRNMIESGATLLRMPVNRRSTQQIVKAGNAIVRGCTWNIAGDCDARPDAPEGEKLLVLETKSAGEESKEIVSWALWTVANKKSMAVLSRTNAWLIPIEAACIAAGLDVTTLGGSTGVWGSSIGETFLAYLMGCSGGPYGKPFFAILNKPSRFTKAADLLAVVKASDGRDLVTELMASANDGLRRFGSDLHQLRQLPWASRVARVAEYLNAHLDAEGGDGDQLQASDQKEAIAQITKLAVELGSLDGIAEYRRKASRGSKDAIVLGSIHKSKGLEYDVVFLAGVNTQKLPHNRASDHWEERRIFYVGVTRARERLILSPGGTPSPFLALLDREA